MDVFELLKQDHQKVSALFDQLESSRDEAARQQLFAQVKQELDLHAHVEETILYPALKEAAETREITLEAYGEHQEVKQLLARMEQAPPSDGRFDDLLVELRTNVEHHVEEEEGEMFTHARSVLTEEQIARISQQTAAAKQQYARTAAG